MSTLDLRIRCERCKKLIRKSAGAVAEYQRYKPFCSYHCQQWGALEDAQRRINSLKRAEQEVK